MKTSTLAVVFILCSAGVSMAQTCKNGVCSLNSLAPHGAVGSAASQPYNVGLNTERRQYFDPSADTFGAGTASKCADGKCGELNCDCHNRRQTEHRVRDRRFQAPVPEASYSDSTNRPRIRAISEFMNPSQPRLSHRPIGSSYRPVAYPAATIIWHSNLREAATIAKQSDRPMLIKISAEWCGYCQQMKRETFSDSRVVRDISQNFVAVDLDADTNGSIVKQLRITSLPTVLVVSPDMRILAREEGFRTAVQIGQLIHRHMQRAQLETGLRIPSR